MHQILDERDVLFVLFQRRQNLWQFVLFTPIHSPTFAAAFDNA